MGDDTVRSPRRRGEAGGNDLPATRSRVEVTVKEAYVLNSYVAVFDAAIAPYLIDQGSTSTSAVTAQSTPTNTTITVAANPNVTGAQVGNVYGQVFQVGTKIVVDVGPQQEADVVIQAISGLSLTVALQNAHGPAQYPVTLQGGEYLARDILKRLDVINGQLKGFAPVTAGLSQADDAKFYSGTRGGRRGSQRGVIDDLIEQRDWARKDLAALLGIQNLWDLRGRFGSSDGGSGSYAAF